MQLTDKELMAAISTKVADIETELGDGSVRRISMSGVDDIRFGRIRGHAERIIELIDRNVG
jgi:hypothetical protein